MSKWVCIAIVVVFVIGVNVSKVIQSIHKETMVVLKQIPSDISQIQAYKSHTLKMRDTIKTMSFEEFKEAEHIKLNLEYDMVRKTVEIMDKLNASNQLGDE